MVLSAFLGQDENSSRIKNQNKVNNEKFFLNVSLVQDYFLEIFLQLIYVKRESFFFRLRVLKENRLEPDYKDVKFLWKFLSEWCV